MALSLRYAQGPGIGRWWKGRRFPSPCKCQRADQHQPTLCGAPASLQPPLRGPILELLICFHSGLSKLNLLIKVVKWNPEPYWLDANAINVTEGEGPRLSIAAQIRSAEAAAQAMPEGWRYRPVYMLRDFVFISRICNCQDILSARVNSLVPDFVLCARIYGYTGKSH